jgi:hypothetical protein
MINPYPDFPHFTKYVITSHPGSGYQGIITIAWKPGMMNDFRDIRFHDDLGRKINYWIQTKTDGSTASIFIKLTSSNAVIVRWGNPAAVSESNIDNTMEFGDEFSGASLNSDKWTGTGAVSGGILTVNDANSVVSKTTFARGSYQIISRWQNTSTANSSGCCVGFGNADTTSCVTSIAYKDAAWLTFRIVTNAGNTSTASGVNISPAAYHVNKLYYSSPSSLIVDSDTTRTLSTNLPSTALAVYIQALWADCSTAVDYIAVRKFNGTDPVFTYVTSGYQPPLSQLMSIFDTVIEPTIIDVSSIVSGGGLSTANTILYNQCSSSVAATGLQTAANNQLIMISSSILGSGEQTTNPQLLKMLSSSISGEGLLTANLITLIQNSSSITATGSQTANVSQFIILSSSISGSGETTAQIIKIIQLNSSLSGSGEQTANPIEYSMLSSIVSGVGLQTANCSGGEEATIINLSSNVEGGGSQTALANLLQIISSTCTATGQALATPMTLANLSSTVEATGQAQAIVELQQMISSAIEGTGSQTANPIIYKLLSSAIAGVGRSSAHVTFVEIEIPDIAYPLTIAVYQNKLTVEVYQNKWTVTII